ncbi:MAG: pilus assembly protein N-terminal domain-containing protein [Candidatus Eremiobacteraeota bacterium]|nr:pilus assembly protein N-terminal domain-containing protein [Candidatus Eremiobacteraeota bacterium]
MTITPSSLFFSQPGEQHTLTLSGPVTVMAQNPSVVTVMGTGNSFTIRALQAGTTTLLISGPGWSTRVTVNVASTGPARPHA